MTWVVKQILTLLDNLLLKDLSGINRFNGVLLHGSQRLSKQIPVTLWFPFCGGQSCSVKREWAAVSQLLSVGRRQAEWLLAAAAWIFIPAVQQDSIIDCSSTRYWGHTLLCCMPLSSLPLQQLSSLPLFSLSWLETGEYGEKCWGCS